MPSVPSSSSSSSSSWLRSARARARWLALGLGLLAPAAAHGSPFAYVWSNADLNADSDVTVIDLATDQIHAVLEAGNGPINGVAVSPDGEHLFVALHNGPIFVYQVSDALHLELRGQDIGSSPSGIAFTPDGTEVYVSHLYAGYITRLAVADWIVPDDPTTTSDDVRPAYSFGSLPTGGRFLALNQWGDEAVVAHDAGELSIVDVIAETWTLQTNGAAPPGGLALVPGSGLMVVSEPGANRVRLVPRGTGGVNNHTVQEARGVLARYEGQSLKIQVAEAAADQVTTLGAWAPIGTSDRPFGVAYSADQAVLVTANYGDDTMSILRASPVTIPVPDTAQPTGIAVGPPLPPVARRESPLRIGYRICGETVLARIDTANQGSGMLRLGRSAIGGADARAFTVLKDGCGDRSIAPGGRCAIDVRFTASRDAGTKGIYNATLTTTTNDPLSKTLMTTVQAKPLGLPCGG